MKGPILALILFLCFVAFVYYYQNYFTMISKILYMIFAFLLLIVPQYVESIPNYLFYKTQILNYNINESKLYNTKLNKDDKLIILQNQNNECIECKKKLKKNFCIKSINMLDPNLSNYFIICNVCNRKKYQRKLRR